VCGGQRKPPDLFGRLSLSIVCVSHAQKTRARHATAAECAKLGFVSVLFFKMVLRGPPPFGEAKVKKFTEKSSKNFVNQFAPQQGSKGTWEGADSAETCLSKCIYGTAKRFNASDWESVSARGLLHNLQLYPQHIFFVTAARAPLDVCDDARPTD